MPRVAGADPGTSSLDLLVLDGGAVADQARFPPQQLDADPAAPIRWLRERGPFDLIAGPSGYGLPLVWAADCSDRDLHLMSLVRPDERGQARGVVGFSSLVRAFRDSGLPVVFLTGVINLPTVADFRKYNRIDLGTADKLCVTALALAQLPRRGGRFCVVELGTAFTACLAVAGGRVIHAAAGTAGPVGWRSGGAWDGEAAYLLGPLAKGDLFAGGASDLPDAAGRLDWLRQSLRQTVAGLHEVTPFGAVYLSGQLLKTGRGLARTFRNDLKRFGPVELVPTLPGATVKHAAQGAAVIADGLAGGRFASVVKRMRLREASGTALDWLRHPRAVAVRRAFGVSS
jgi:predicted butyrate kinase (DUF1464 family)